MRIAGFLALHPGEDWNQIVWLCFGETLYESPKKSCNGSFHRSIAGAETAGQNHEFLGALERGR